MSMRRSTLASAGSSSLLSGYAAVILVLLYLPIFVVAILSVNDAPATGFPFRRFTLHWFELVLTSDVLLRSIGNSIALGLLSATVATALALALALALRRDIPGKAAILNLLLIPIILPGIIAGATLFVLFQLLGLPISLWTSALCAHVTCVLPFAFLNIHPRLHALDPAVEEAAADLGASRRQLLTHIVLPLIRPAIVAAWLFAFSLSFDEFVRTLLLTSYERTLPIQFWYLVVENFAPEAPSMAVVITLISVTTSFLAFAISGRSAAKA